MKMIKKIFLISIGLFILIFQSKVYASQNEDVIVLLDPGHGGVLDSGATSGGLLETDITWKITTKVKEILDNTEGITGILSRGKNTNPTIAERGQMAKNVGADLLVSFHINASPSSLPRGSEVYVTINDRVDRFYKNSNQLAINILNNLSGIGIPRNGSTRAKKRGTESNNMYPDGSWADYYGVIRYPMMYGIPGVLIEHCFITNLADREFINNDYQISRIAQADAQAIIANKELFRIDKTKNASKAALNTIFYDNNTGSIKGNVLYNEVINDMNADAMPRVVLVATDGSEFIEAKVEKECSYTYRYDINIMNINFYKEYFLRVETKDVNSIPQNNSIILSMADQKLGQIYCMDILCQNGKINLDSPKYNGYMTSSPYGNISVNNNILSGNLIVQEWIDGVNQAEPKANPIVLIKSDDGTQLKCYVEYIQPYVYKFAIDLANVDKSKKYKVEVQCNNNKNISNHTKVNIDYPNITIGNTDDSTVVIENNRIIFKINGYMTNSPYGEINLNGSIMTGKLIIQEWINGTKQVEPTTIPKIVLNGANGNQIVGTIRKIEPYVYGYTFNISGINKETTYEMEVQCTDENNISTHKDVVVNYSNRTIGKIEEYILQYLNKKILFAKVGSGYEGYMTNAPYGEINLSGNTISGRLVIQEWINGITQVEPVTMPKVVLKDANKNQIVGTIRKIEPYVYEYKFDLSSANKETKYEMEVQCTNENNISTHKDVVVNYSNRTIGKIGDYTLKYQNQKLVFEEIDLTYNGYMTNAPYGEIKLSGNTITGRLIIQEWRNGTKQVEPTTMPKIVLKGANGTQTVGTIRKIEPYVYEYTFNISGINKETTYEMEVQSTDVNNISTHKDVVVNYSNRTIGKIGDYTLKYQNQKLIFEKINLQYEGYINIITSGEINLSGNTISGRLVIQEWINGTKQVEPTSMPKIVLKGVNGTQIVGTIRKIEPYVYEYTFNISGINKETSYEMEVQSTDVNNISTHKNGVVNYNDKVLGKVENYTLKYQNQKLIFENI